MLFLFVKSMITILCMSIERIKLMLCSVDIHEICRKLTMPHRCKRMFYLPACIQVHRAVLVMVPLFLPTFDIYVNDVLNVHQRTVVSYSYRIWFRKWCTDFDVCRLNSLDRAIISVLANEKMMFHEIIIFFCRRYPIVN